MHRYQHTGFSVKTVLALFGALIVAVPNCVTAQETLGIPSATTRGMRHILYLTIKSDDPDLRFLRQGTGEPHRQRLLSKSGFQIIRRRPISSEMCP